MTPFVPRLHATLLDAECRASLAVLGLRVEDVLRSRESSARAGARAEDVSTPAVVDRLRAVAAEAARRLEQQRGALAEIDRGLAVQLGRTADQVRELVDKLCTRAERAERNRSGSSRRHVRRVEASLIPRGLPQERVLSTLQFNARFGSDWLDGLLGAIDPFPHEHLVVHLPAGGEAGTTEAGP